MERKDDFKTRRLHLADLSDSEIKERFWSLAEQIVDPLLDLGYKNTSPSIERSILLRMGFSSLEAKEIVEHTINYGLMGKGAGNIVYRLAKEKDMPIREAGVALAEGKYWEDISLVFKGGN